MSKPLTAKQQFWSQHLQQAEHFEGSLADYARAKDLPAQNLYRWRNLLRKRQITHTATKTVFTEVSQPTIRTTSLALTLGAAQLEFSALPNVQWLAELIDSHE